MLGRLERVSRDSVAAEKAFKKALDLDASNEEALTGLAMVYSELGDTKNAIEMLRLVTSKNPNPRTLSALASFYERTRDFASATEAWRQALQMDPENSRIKRALAEDVLRTGRLDDALKLYSEIAPPIRGMRRSSCGSPKFTGRRATSPRPERRSTKRMKSIPTA